MDRVYELSALVLFLAFAMSTAVASAGPEVPAPQPSGTVPGLLVTTVANPGGFPVERRLHLATDEAARLADIDVAGAVSAPDGATIAWVEEVRTINSNGFGAVFLMDVVSGDLQRVGVPILTEQIAMPLAFSDDGSELVGTTEQGIVAIDTATGDFALWPGTIPGDTLLDAGLGQALIVRRDQNGQADFTVLAADGNRMSVPADSASAGATSHRGAIAPDGTGIAISERVSSSGFAGVTMLVGTADDGLAPTSFSGGGIFNSVTSIAWSLDSGSVAAGLFSHSFGPTTSLVETFDRQAQSLHVAQGPLRVAGWLPDGTGLVVEAARQANTSQVQVIDPSGEVRETLGTVVNLDGLTLVPGNAFSMGALAPLASDTVADALYYSSFNRGLVDTVLLARDDDFPDALASGVLQGTLGAPLLLTPGDRLDLVVIEEILRLGATHAVLLGGTSALSPAIEAELTERGLTFERVAGSNRLATAVQIADRAGGISPTVLLVRAGAGAADPSQGWADSIGAGAVAATHGLSILLTDTSTLSPATAEALQQADVERVIVVGGATAISEDVVGALRDLGLAVRRVAGAGRAETAAALAAFGAELGPAADGAPGRSIGLDSGAERAWAAGFAAALHTTASAGNGVFLVAGSLVPDATIDGLGAAEVQDPDIPFICGIGVVIEACQQMFAALTED